MNFIFFEQQRIGELQNLLQDIYCNIIIPAGESFKSRIALLSPDIYGRGNIARLIDEINREFDLAEKALLDNLSFLKTLEDKYAEVEEGNRRTLETLLANLTLYDGTDEAVELIPDISVSVNQTLRYIYDNLVQGYEEQVKAISLKGFTVNPEAGHFISDTSERNIVSKYLTKLDFNFLSSLSDVYDFFDFADMDILMLNPVRDTVKQNLLKPDEEPLETAMVNQLQRFPDLKQVLPDAADNELRNVIASKKSLAGKIEIEPESGVSEAEGLDGIGESACTERQKQGIGVEEYGVLNSVGDTTRAESRKQNEMAAETGALNSIGTARNILTKKVGIDESDSGVLGDLSTVDVSGGTHFGQLNSKDESMRRFRAVNKFNFVEDETEEQADYIRVNRAGKTKKEAVEEGDIPEDLEAAFIPVGQRTIAPPEFIEGLADELQLMEAAIRKQLKWEESEFNDFLDFVYSLAHTAEFPQAPIMIVYVFAAIINYIVSKAFQKAEGL